MRRSGIITVLVLGMLACQPRFERPTTAPVCVSPSRATRIAHEHFCALQNGVREGPAAYTYEDGSVREWGSFHNNRREGTWTYWREDGSLWQRTEWRDGKVVRLTPNFADCPSAARRHGDAPPAGRAIWCQERLMDGNWRNHGPFTAWYDDGRPQAEGSYLHGEPDGEFTMWFADGRPKARGTYADGLEEGLQLSWHDNGNMFIRALFEHGKEQGPWTSWWEEGGKSAEGQFHLGEESGHWAFWHPNGTRSEEGGYVDGKKNGWWRAWDVDGHPLPMEEYRLGVRIGTAMP